MAWYYPKRPNNQFSLSKFSFGAKKTSTIEYLQKFLYLRQFWVLQRWKIVVIFPYRRTEPKRHPVFASLFQTNCIEVIYLEDHLKTTEESLTLDTFRLILSEPTTAPPLANKLLRSVLGTPNVQLEKIIEAILWYKFPKLTRKEIEAMLDLDFDLTQTAMYQEAKEEGKAVGLQEGKRESLLTFLQLRFGALSEPVLSRIQSATMPELDAYLLRIWSLKTPDDLFN